MTDGRAGRETSWDLTDRFAPEGEAGGAFSTKGEEDGGTASVSDPRALPPGTMIGPAYLGTSDEALADAYDLGSWPGEDDKLQ